MARRFVCLAVTCSSELEALMVVYLAVCCRIAGIQIQARISPANAKAADLLWPENLDQKLINLADPALDIQSTVAFQLSSADSFPDAEQMRTSVLESLRQHLAA